ncbi:hypothetical protein OC846_006679 [Tilletia horrida]|uniref:Dickkopf N-terminal cysteine-rich domain-containing protein n=1 Tax=Tilletia horrida TaxID=155126 RepID=A0AAN6GJK4_9BASI|nr:hypothetical protein OC845_006696 [Tilletia horrida]KAK0542630.1 hypothetical protein OC846_006679 [Tilletia horrida]KAK0558994.1 hypothetical protein OC861_006774 [Tilletia horrida]
MLAFTWAKAWVARLVMVTILFQAMTYASPSQLNVDLPTTSAALVARGTIAPNQLCDGNSDCASKSCKFESTPESCDLLNSTGSVVTCPDSVLGFRSDKGYCRGFPLNHTCANQGECRNGYCSKKNGTCIATYVGQACKDDLGCSNPQVCRNGKCFKPAAASLYPNESCKVGSSCKSGKCVTFFDPVTESYTAGAGYDYVEETRPVCNYLQNGQKGCRTLDDCQDALCLDGVCKQGADGQRCLDSFQCINVCGLDGVCYTPSKLISAGDPCKTNASCYSNDCTDGYGPPISRPDFRNPGKNFSAIPDLRCFGRPSGFGGVCGNDEDCNQGVCQSGKCKGLPLGSPCPYDNVCASLTCGEDTGKCAIGQAGAPCAKGSDCYSSNCKNNVCQPVWRFAKCRTFKDCGPEDYCNSDNRCVKQFIR